MKNKKIIRLIALAICAILLVTAVMVPVITMAEEEVTEAPAAYKLSGVSFEGGALKGTANHVDGTATVKNLYVRITFYSENGSTFVTESFVHDDGNFTGYASGNIVAVSVTLTEKAGTPTMTPGTYSKFDAVSKRI